jgi:hypothetical protein
MNQCVMRTALLITPLIAHAVTLPARADVAVGYSATGIGALSSSARSTVATGINAIG